MRPLRPRVRHALFATFKTTESPFKSDNTSSNKCGVTLMNNQIGRVVADVMATHEGVTVMPLPSMIRVDAINRMDFVYEGAPVPNPGVMMRKQIGVAA